MANNQRQNVCVIGGRKGSKRLPGKNKLDLAGKPLYRWALDAALESQVFDNIVISTDDPDILAELAGLEGVVLDRRPPELADDQTPIWETIAYLSEFYTGVFTPGASVTLITPCHPLRTAIHLREALKLFHDSGALSLVSVTPFPCPPALAVEVDQGRVRRAWSGPARKGEHGQAFYPNGAIYIMDLGHFLTTREIYSENTVAYQMAWPDGLDIDEPKDLELAQRLAGCPGGHIGPGE